MTRDDLGAFLLAVLLLGALWFCPGCGPGPTTAEAVPADDGVTRYRLFVYGGARTANGNWTWEGVEEENVSSYSGIARLRLRDGRLLYVSGTFVLEQEKP